MLNSFMFGKHPQHYSGAHIQAMLKRFSVVADLNSLVTKGFKVAFECIPEVLQRKQQLFADLTALLDQRGVEAQDVLLCSCTSSLSIRSISMGAMTRYKSRLIGVSPSDQWFKFTIHCEQQPGGRFCRVKELSYSQRPANHGGRASSNVEQLHVWKTSPALLCCSHSGDAQKIQRRSRSQRIGQQRVQSGI